MAYMQQIALRIEVATLKKKGALRSDEFFAIVASEPYNSSIIDPSNLATLLKAAVDCCNGGSSKLQALKIVFEELFPCKYKLAFKLFEADVIAHQLMLRILDPGRIDQKAYGLCGPAAFAISLVRSHPLQYARLAVDLAIKGKAQLGGLVIAPNMTVRDYNPRGQIAEVDWIVLASVANEEDVLSKETKGELGTYGGSGSEQMCSWLSRAGFRTVMALHVKYSDTTYGAKMLVDKAKTSKAMYLLSFIAPLVVSFKNTYAPRVPSFIEEMGDEWKAEKNLRIAAKLVKQGWRVFMFITESIANPTSVNGLKEQMQVFQEMFSGVRPPTLGPEQIEKWEKDKAYWMRTEQEIRDDIISRKMLEATGSNHWGLATEINIDDSDEDDPRVSAVIYSYGKRSTLPLVKLSVFFNCYSGFVAANVRDISYLESQWYAYDRGYVALD